MNLWMLVIIMVIFHFCSTCKWCTVYITMIQKALINCLFFFFLFAGCNQSALIVNLYVCVYGYRCIFSLPRPPNIFHYFRLPGNHTLLNVPLLSLFLKPHQRLLAELPVTLKGQKSVVEYTGLILPSGDNCGSFCSSMTWLLTNSASQNS